MKRFLQLSLMVLAVMLFSIEADARKGKGREIIERAIEKSRETLRTMSASASSAAIVKNAREKGLRDALTDLSKILPTAARGRTLGELHPQLQAGTMYGKIAELMVIVRMQSFASARRAEGSEINMEVLQSLYQSAKKSVSAEISKASDLHNGVIQLYLLKEAIRNTDMLAELGFPRNLEIDGVQKSTLEVVETILSNVANGYMQGLNRVVQTDIALREGNASFEYSQYAAEVSLFNGGKADSARIPETVQSQLQTMFALHMLVKQTFEVVRDSIEKGDRGGLIGIYGTSGRLATAITSGAKFPHDVAVRTRLEAELRRRGLPEEAIRAEVDRLMEREKEKDREACG